MIPGNQITGQLPADLMLIEFADEHNAVVSKGFYEKSRLSRLDHFQAMISSNYKETVENRVKILECTQPIFDIVLPLIADQAQLQEIFLDQSHKEVLYDTPDLYEQIEKAIRYFHPECPTNNTKQVLENLRNTPFHLSLCDAHNILSRYEQNCKKIIAIFNKHTKKNSDLDSPYLIRIAKTTICTSKYFSSIDQADSYFNSLCSLQIQKIQLETFLKEKISVNTLQESVLDNQIQDIQHQLQVCEIAIFSLKKETTSLPAKEIMARYIKDKDPEIRALAKQALEDIAKIYEKKITSSSNTDNFSLGSIPKRFRTYKLCNLAVASNGNNRKDVPLKHKIRRTCEIGSKNIRSVGKHDLRQMGIQAAKITWVTISAPFALAIGGTVVAVVGAGFGEFAVPIDTAMYIGDKFSQEVALLYFPY